MLLIIPYAAAMIHDHNIKENATTPLCNAVTKSHDFQKPKTRPNTGPKGVIRETGLQELAQDRKVIAVQGS